MPHCFVPGCRNSDKKKQENISFHAIPKSNKQVWLCAIGRPEDTIIIQQRICSEHFCDNDFQHIGLLKCLKPNVVPSLKLPIKKDKIIVEKQPSDIENYTLSDSNEDPVVLIPSTLGIQQFNKMTSGSSVLNVEPPCKKLKIAAPKEGYFKKRMTHLLLTSQETSSSSDNGLSNEREA